MNNYHHLFKELNNDTVILTPNRRLAATLQKSYHEFQIENEKQCWPTPAILPVTSWLQGLFHDYANQQFIQVPLLLNNAQEQFIWQTILSNAKESAQLLQVSETADLVKSAWGLLKQWRIDIEQPIFTSTEDAIFLKQWIKQFQQYSEEKNYLDIQTLPDFIVAKIQSQLISIPKTIILIGFTEISPQFNYLLSACTTLGAKISQCNLQTHQYEAYHLKCSDNEDEILSMARWAKKLLAQNPTHTIGCVIPSLDKIRDRVVQLFSACFAEENTYCIDKQNSPFNISAGKSLTQYPIIHSAFQLLGLHKKNITLEHMTYILNSPFLGESENERMRRANYEKLLRQENMSHLPLLALINENNSQKIALEKYCPQLTKRLRVYFQTLASKEKSMLCSEWAVFFNQLLTVMGWPGERSVNSEEYQVVESWLSLLTEFQTLDQISEAVTLSQALQILQKLAAKTLFQPQTPAAPIQVLGVLEAAGLSFDHLWVAGMDDMSWPPQPKPNPFIPKSLQRELHMPHATAERELAFCQTITDQFKQSAEHLIFSYAEKNDEVELQASALIRDLPSISINDLALLPYLPPELRIFATQHLDTLSDEIAPILLSNETIRGGASILKNQALCPFKSFAEWRLHAQELEAPLPGLRAKDRGTIVHKALELLWDELKDQANLLALNEFELHNHIDNAVLNALQKIPYSHNEWEQYISLEKKRLAQLISDWLRIEKNRGPFKVLTSEKSAEIKLNNISLNLRIDRIDELADGKKLIIDYKTGKNNDIKSWFSERPDEPQLPLYSLLDPENTMGISFAQIASGHHGFKGISQYSLDLKGVKLVSETKQATILTWPDQLNHWQMTLSKLSKDFQEGIAHVDPKDPVDTCTYCQLKPLCRINEEV